MLNDAPSLGTVFFYRVTALSNSYLPIVLDLPGQSCLLVSCPDTAMHWDAFQKLEFQGIFYFYAKLMLGTQV